MDDGIREDDYEDKDLWWRPDTYDNLLLKPDADVGACPMSPSIMIYDTDGTQSIEIAEIESSFHRNLTPEGNVKYRNYKVLAPSNIPIRMYSPSGDINVTPKKGKIMPKFDLFDDFNKTREKLLDLIVDQSPCSQFLRDIIKPSGLSHRAMEELRKTNVSNMDDYVQFLKTVNYSPSPSFSMFSDETERCERHESPPSSPEIFVKKLYKSQSIDEDRVIQRKLVRQVSVPSDGINRSQMCLSDELYQASRKCLRSHTPRSMFRHDYRPVSALSENVSGRRTPSESKKSILRSFIQRNMIVNAVDRNDLAKLALAIEEDSEEAEDCCNFVNSARILEKKVQAMLEEVRDLKEIVIDINEDIEESDIMVLNLLTQTKSLYDELDVLHYLDDIITLLNGGTNLIRFKNWPFLFPNQDRKNNPNLNLIV